jgi:2-C-methyl-D-erythritol 4-phosphate cytidylyltransferase/2-C-methyl-D-erythritol 2,4-cyclodiphosphate synthase
MTPKAAAIIPAAGSGTRMNSTIPKQFLPLAGTPILARTISTFIDCPFISQIIVAAPQDSIADTENMLASLCAGKTPIHVVQGGMRRQDSVRAALDFVGEDIEVVLVHDGARPLVSIVLIERCYQEILTAGAAIAVVPVKDTLKKEAPGPVVDTTIDRSRLWQAQTPQGALKNILVKAFERGRNLEVTDESALLEELGIPVSLVYGETTNIKITSPEDLEYGEKLLNQNTKVMKIGHGFDAHRFADDRKLVLGGEEIDHARGLAGHSDADVLTHALCDAILGALGKGDIGRHFPDNDATYKNIRSTILLERVIESAGEQHFSIANADITIICQAPKLAPYIEKMRANLAACCNISPQSINIKATTTEKMGFTGRQEGISCHAVVLLER